MQRRAFITLLSGGAIGWPWSVGAQPKVMPVIGYMSGGSASFYAGRMVPAFREGLREAGYVDGVNLMIEYRWAEGDYDRLPAFAAEFVSRNVSLIAATGSVSALRAAKAATSTIPVVFTSGSDPVAEGLVASLARPGGNLTGISFLTTQLYPKRVQLLSEAVPQARSIAMLVNANAPGTDENLREAAAAAEALGKKLLALRVGTIRNFVRRLGMIRRKEPNDAATQRASYS